MRAILFGAAFAVSGVVGPAAALTISQSSDVAAGIAAFGQSTPLITWSNLFPSGTTWATGVGPGPGVHLTNVASDPVTGSVVTSPPNGIHNGINEVYVANWIDGPGFNQPGSVAGPELGLDGEENFKLSFANGVTKIGFAISTGRGILSGEIDHTGALFQVTTNNGDAGTLTLVDPGDGLVAWVTVQSLTPFTSITFNEPSGNVWDQYFGNIARKSHAASQLSANAIVNQRRTRAARFAQAGESGISTNVKRNVRGVVLVQRVGHRGAPGFRQTEMIMSACCGRRRARRSRPDQMARAAGWGRRSRTLP